MEAALSKNFLTKSISILAQLSSVYGVHFYHEIV